MSKKEYTEGSVAELLWMLKNGSFANRNELNEYLTKIRIENKEENTTLEKNKNIGENILYWLVMIIVVPLTVIQCVAWVLIVFSIVAGIFIIPICGIIMIIEQYT